MEGDENEEAGETGNTHNPGSNVAIYNSGNGGIKKAKGDEGICKISVLPYSALYK